MDKENMNQSTQQKYSSEDLQEFEVVITKKLKKANEELAAILGALGKKKENSTEAKTDKA